MAEDDKAPASPSAALEVLPAAPATSAEPTPRTNGTSKTLPPPPGVDPDEWNNEVEFTPEQQKRFNKVYRDLKETKRDRDEMKATVSQLVSDNTAMMERLDEFMSSQVEDKHATRIEQLTAAQAAAVEDGDIAEVQRLTNEIAETRVAASSATQQKAAPKTPAAPEPVKTKGGLTLTESDETALNLWATEMDDDGNYLRPWSHERHPRYEEFVEVVQRIAPTVQTVDEGMRLVDQHFAGQRRATGPAVLSGDGNIRPNDARNTEITADMRSVAIQMFGPGTKFDLAPAEAVERYAKASQKWSRQR